MMLNLKAEVKVNMSIKKFYYYFFYRLYRLWNKAYHPFLSGNFRAEVSIVALEMWLLLSIGIYYIVVTKKIANLTLTNPFVIIPLVGILILNYFAFIHTNAWQNHCKEFDQLPKKLNRRWGMLVWSIIVFIILNLIFAFYLMSTVNWKLYQ